MIFVMLSRESCLQNIVENLFEKKGWTIYNRPSFSGITPDLLLKKDEEILVIELKAYPDTIICGEAEIGQVIKYYDNLCNLKKRGGTIRASKKIKERGIRMSDYLKIDTIPKVILITSGKLNYRNFYDYMENLKSDDNTLIVKHYKELMEALPSPREALDFQDAYGIYKSNIKKWEKLSWEHPFRMLELSKIHVKLWDKYLADDIITIPSNIFHDILCHENLSREAQSFRLLQDTPLEKIMINPLCLEM